MPEEPNVINATFPQPDICGCSGDCRYVKQTFYTCGRTCDPGNDNHPSQTSVGCTDPTGGCKIIDTRQTTCYQGDIPLSCIDTLGNGFDLSSAKDGVMFDIAAIGHARPVAWIRGDDAWLALDRNANGTIDNGRELFGNFTPQAATAGRNGFLALAEFDKAPNGGNGDGRISSADAIFSSLRLWRDTNRNGVSEANELQTLPTLGIATLDLKYQISKKVDQYGNEFRYRAKVQDSNGTQAGRWAWDVFVRLTQ